MTVTVVRKPASGIYIGRPSPLGNPFPMRGEHTRDAVCDQYQSWFDEQTKIENSAVIVELRRIYKLAKTQDVTLVCFCAPRRCHGDTVARFLNSYLE